ncbi:origin recognition complex subunit 1 [Lutzomyia longipalpis]|uniref:origin recognition complex subunit 1 n=1 Tax=Lutzomyia longipalpis TaxID=7200 RepID=UPI0024836F24|nr:origin recognition complex subunit 1 [Lutzomyia longipalpis]
MSKMYGCPSNVKWGHKLKSKDVPELQNRKVTFYSKATCGELELSPEACVIVANWNKSNPGRGDIAKIIHIFHVTEEEYKHDRARAIVQWYAWADVLPQRFFTKGISLPESDVEVIEDHRPFENDISLGSISGKCCILDIPEGMSLSTLMENNPAFMEAFTCICRYKLVRSIGRQYRLVPILDNPDGLARSKERPQPRNDHITPHTNRRTSRIRTVSPIKIVGRNVVRLSSVRKSPILLSDASDAENESPNKRRNSEDTSGGQTPRKKSNLNTSTVRRNLNESLNQSVDSDQLNYSIVDVESDALRVRLRVSENQRKKSTPTSPRKRSPGEELKTSPRKTRRSTSASQLFTPQGKSSVRKSILRTPASKLADSSTPRKSITLSNVIEEFPSGRRPSRICTKRQTFGFYCDAADDSPEIPKTPRSARVGRNPTTPKSAGKAQSAATTPSQKMKLLREGVITPTLGSREGALKGRKSLLEVARDHLHVSAVPTSLPCRENEFRDIYQFLEGRIKDGCGGCMYISGVPGTGKTATVTEVIRNLRANAEKLKLPKFQHIEINGMRLTEPRQAYVHIFRQLQGKTVPWEQAYNYLERRFRTEGGKKSVTVLVVDELDMLCNRRQDVVYNLLDWPANRAARLVVVTIANTMDLPERLLKGKVTSRLGLTRLTFKPYSFRQLQEIVTSRLAGFDGFNGDAVQLVSRKVAAVSGDARRALDICRRAVEVAEAEKQGTVSMGHVEKALAEMIANPKVQAIRACSRMEQVFLQAVIAESLRTGVEETTFMGIYAQFETLSSISGHTVPTITKSLEICARLGACRLIISQHSSSDIYQKILLNVSPDDVHYALQDKA